MPNHKLITVWIVSRMYVRHDPMGHIYTQARERIVIPQRKLNVDTNMETPKTLKWGKRKENKDKHFKCGLFKSV